MAINYKKHSAYKSMALAKENKNKTNNGGLKRWIDEDWRNLTPYAYDKTDYKNMPKCGDSSLNPKGKKSVCRPTVKVNDKTPKLGSNYSKIQILKAVKIKNAGKRIDWAKL